MKTIKFLRKILPLIGIIVLLILLRKADIPRVGSNLALADCRYLPLLIFFVPAAFLLNAFKWRLLLEKQKIKVPFFQLLKFNLIGNFYGIVTPGHLGNLIRIDYLKKYTGKSYSQCSASVFLDKIIDLIGILTLAFLGILIFMRFLPKRLFFLGAVVLFLLLLMVIFIIEKRLNKKWLKIVYYRLIPSKRRESLKTVYQIFYRDFPGYSDILWLILFSLLFWLILMTGSYLIFIALGIKINWFYAIMTLAIAVMVSLLPISFSGWGTREAALFVLFAPFGISIEQILSFSILNFFLISFLPGLIGAILSILEKK